VNRQHIMAVLYDITMVIGGEVKVKPLLTRTLQRMLYHTSFPAGLALLDLPGDQSAGEVTVRLDAAVGDYELGERVGQQFTLPAALVRGDAALVEDTALLQALPCARKAYGVCLRLPIEGCGVILLLARSAPHTELPLTQIFQPVMANLGKAVMLCRHNEAYAASLTNERDVAREELGESEQRFRLLGSAAPDAIAMLDDRGAVAYWNPAAQRLFGYAPDEILGREAHRLIVPPRFYDAFARGFEQFRSSGSGPMIGHSVEVDGLRKDGSEFPVELSVSAFQFRGHWHAIGIMRDITERHLAEVQLRIAATAFEAQEGIIITDADQTILRVNRAFSDISGYAAEEAVGQTPRLLQSHRHDVAFYQRMWQAILADGFWQGEIWNRRKSGEIYPEWLNVTAVRSEQGDITHYVGTLTDITARKAAEKQIEHLAYYDLLTQLPNRRLLRDRLQQALAGSIRSQRTGALLFIDLDNFKIINDTCGHDVGDQLLVEVARRLGGCVRVGDTVARPGGDEFVIMLDDLSDNPQEAATLAKDIGGKILSALNQPYALAGRVHHSTPSIGIALFANSGDTVDELLKKADIAMYQAKSAGRNTLRFFDPEMQATLATRAVLEAALRLGIVRSQFVLHYQAQVDGHGRILGAEALLRWEHPERGMVSPAQFIPLAEETGLILPIGQWVLEAACALLRDWAADPRTRDLYLAVNVSGRQFRQADFVAQVGLALANGGAPASRLKLELTESVVLDDIEDSIGKMQALKRLGVGFSMDDFGTGYSSLSYLTRLPLDQLKIDQSFVRNLPDNANDAVIVQTIITMARSLGLAVIAEGVETEAQRQFLDRNGCPTCQGYLFSKPVALAQFDQLLRSH
jgi:diguanylate cyclase (GGDEF)-like protein/PAS domain S-box-containing protein